MAKPELKAVDAQREVKPAMRLDRQIREHARVDWVVNAPQGTRKEDIENPQFWTAVSEHMARFHRVEVVGFEGTWIAEILVLDAGKGRVFHGKTLRIIDVPPADDSKRNELPADYDVVKDQRTGKWQAVRLRDGHKFGPEDADYEVVRRALVDHAIFRGQ